MPRSSDRNQDFEANQNSVMVINHVTEQQFRQCIHRLDLKLAEADVAAIAAYFDDRGDGTVNYRAFVNYVDPVRRPSFQTRDAAHM
eukprot:SAG31_NODE_13869_length_841_cov_1.114555_1_plen_86_part_00